MLTPTAARLVCPTLLALLCATLLPVARADDAPPPADEKTQAAALIEAFRDKDLEIRLKAAEEAQVLQHESLTSPLVKLLADKERAVREAAIEALALRSEAKARRKAADALADRLARVAKHPADRPELLQSIAALKRLAQPSSIKALLDGIEVEMDLEEVEARIFAVAEVPHKEAVEALIDFLALGRRGGRAKHRELANKALRYATGSTPGEENRTAGHDADRWRAWWRENEKTFDFEAIANARAEEADRAREREERKKEAKAKREEKGKDKGKGKGKEERKKGPQGADKPKVTD